MEPGSTQGLLALVIDEVLWISLVSIIEGRMRPEVAQLIKSVIMVRMHCTVGHFTSRLGSLLDTEASQPVVSVLVELSDLTASLAFFPVPRHLDKRLPRYLVQDRALLIEVNWSLLMVEYTLAELAGHLLGWRICYYRP